MGLAHSPKIVTDGLLCYYDMSNTQKSWQGAPTTNLAPFTDYSNRTYYIKYDVGGFGGDDADVYYYPNGGYNNLPYKKMIKHTGGTGGSFNTDHETFTLVEGKTYRISCWMKASRTVTLNGYALDLNRSTDNAYRVGGNPTLTTDWQRITWTYTCGVGEGGTYQSRQIIYTDDILPTEVYWSGFQVEENSIHTPYVKGTRSNTQSLLDLTGNNTITVNSLTYAADNTFSFNGTTDYLTIPFSATSGQAVTYCGWLYSTETVSTYRNFVDSAAAKPMIWWNNSGQIEFDTGASYTTPAVYRNQWVYVALSKPSGLSSASYYVNGNFVGSGGAYTTPAGTPTWFNRAAGQCWKGSCSNVQIYNRALSAAEVQQNFQALRGRYGI